MSKGTRLAIVAAILGVQRAVLPTIVENKQYSNGLPQYGYFYAIVDDGTGVPDSAFMTVQYEVVDATRACGVAFSVFAPELLMANISLLLSIAAGRDSAAIMAAVNTAIRNYVNALTSGQTLSLTQVARVAYLASSDVLDVTNVEINGVASELVATSAQVIKAGSVGAIV